MNRPSVRPNDLRDKPERFRHVYITLLKRIRSYIRGNQNNDQRQLFKRETIYFETTNTSDRHASFLIITVNQRLYARVAF